MSDYKTEDKMNETLQTTMKKVDSVESEIKILAELVTKTDSNINNLGSLVEVQMTSINKRLAPLELDVKRVTTKKVEPTTIFAFIMLMLALWAAAIRPLASDVVDLESHNKEQYSVLIERAEFMGRQEALSEIDRLQIDKLTAQNLETMKTRFTNADGDRLRLELNNRIDTLKQAFLNEKLSK